LLFKKLRRKIKKNLTRSENELQFVQRDAPWHGVQTASQPGMAAGPMVDRRPFFARRQVFSGRNRGRPFVGCALPTKRTGAVNTGFAMLPVSGGEGG
jgi:hypothetical protein